MSPREPRGRFAAALLALVAAAMPLGAQPPAAGPERRVANDPAAVLTYCPALAGRPTGGFAVAWEETLFTGENFFRTLSVAVGDPLDEVGPARGVDLSFLEALIPGELGGDGAAFTLAWTRLPLAGGPPSQQAVPLDEAGNVAGDAVALDPLATISPRLVGGFVALRRLPAAFSVQLLAADGEAVGPPALVRDASAEGWAVLHRSDGRFVVVWSSTAVRGRQTVSLGVKVLRFGSAGRPQGRPSTLVPPRGATTMDVLAAIGADGALAIAYAVPGASHSAAFLRTYDAQGRPRGGPLALPPDGVAGGLAVDATGRVLLVWSSASDGGGQVSGQLFSAASQPLGAPFPLASEASATHGAARCPRAAAAGGSSGWTWAVSWVGRDGDGHDALYVRRFWP
jgi:hypothetical protein